jgi:hypothetical protein
MTDIVIAKRELYDALKGSLRDVTGAGIKWKNGSEYIVIFVSNDSQQLIDKIPHEFKGNQVLTEVRSLAHAW